MNQSKPWVTLVIEVRVRPGSRRQQPGRQVAARPIWIANVEWTAPGSGAAMDRWLVHIVLDPSDGGPVVRHVQSLVSHSARSQHVIEVALEGMDAGPISGTYRGIATLSRRSTPGDTGSVGGFTDLGIFRFPTMRRDPDAVVTELHGRRRSGASRAR
jgi:hypothetical protein